MWKRNRDQKCRDQKFKHNTCTSEAVNSKTQSKSFDYQTHSNSALNWFPIPLSVVARGLKRMRSNFDEDDDDDMSDAENLAADDNSGDENNDDAKWSKKLKRPRMSMVADEEETK